MLTLSLHGRNNFPFRKQHSKIDIEFEDKTGDDEYLSILAGTLPRVFAFEPEVIFFQSGVDTLVTDRLGRLALAPAGIRRRNEMVAEACHRYGVPFIVTMGGGYSDPVERTAEAHASTYITVRRVFG